MDDRIRDRRRSVSRQRGRRRAIPIILLILVMAAAGSFLWLRSSSVFAVKTITATATERISQQEIAAVTASALGVNLLQLSTAPIEEALSTLPYVRSAQVYRAFPNTLEVRLEEYTPLARVQVSEGNTWLVSEDGRALERITAPRGYSLPLVIPAAALSLTAGSLLPAEITAALPVVSQLVAGAMADKLPDIKQVEVSAAGEVALTLADGSQLRLGRPVDLERKLTVAAEIIQQCLRDSRQVEYVDVSVPTRPAVMAK